MSAKEGRIKIEEIIGPIVTAAVVFGVVYFFFRLAFKG